MSAQIIDITPRLREKRANELLSKSDSIHYMSEEELHKFCAELKEHIMKNSDNVYRDPDGNEFVQFGGEIWSIGKDESQ
jgi:hypothetical protein